MIPKTSDHYLSAEFCHRNPLPLSLCAQRCCSPNIAPSCGLSHIMSNHNHDRQIPGNKGPTATPTAAVVFALFTSVMLVQFAVDEQHNLQVHGIQDDHLNRL